MAEPVLEPIQVDEETRKELFELGHKFGPMSISGLMIKLVADYHVRGEEIIRLEKEVAKAQNREISALDHVEKLTKQILRLEAAKKDAAKQNPSKVKRGPGRPRKVVEDEHGQPTEPQEV